MALPTGKLDAAVLTGLLDKHVTLDERVIVGPRVGEDAAVLDMGDRYLVASTDPITFVTEDLGWSALVVNANDLAVRGARPRWFLATCLLPEGRTTENQVEALFADLGVACRALGVAWIGGHTEVTPGLGRPLVVGTMLGEVAKDRLVTTRGAQPGDVLLLTKGVPLEGTSIIAREKGAWLRARGVSEALLSRARAYGRCLSVVPEALLVSERGWAHAMHDPTEGGLATALWELADAAEVGLGVELGRIPVLDEGRALCAMFNLDPLGTIASGALLAAVPPAQAETARAALGAAGIRAELIGEVLPRTAGVRLWVDGRSGELPRFAQDEITKLCA
jgi:hydrogenase maturation factor